MSIRVGIATIVVVVAAGCVSDGGGRVNASAENTSRVERCTQRLLEREHGAPTKEAERYVKVAYCMPFERRGWVYENGTVSIDAYLHVASGG